MAKIRPLALAVIRRGDQLLVSPGRAPVDGVEFYRPPGGRIEFGEKGAATIVREIEEELDATVGDVRYLGLIENVFSFMGKAGHELVMVYEARFDDAALYTREVLLANEGDAPFECIWKSPAEIAAEGRSLVPEGIDALL